jgi:serine/threonine-protein kinase RsbW
MTPVDRPSLTFDRVIRADVRLLVTMRADLRTWLLGHGVAEDDCDMVVLAVSEAMANSVEHAYRGDPTGLVFVSGLLRDDMLEVAVSDRGDWVPPRLDPDNTLNGLNRGRGLALIGQLMDKADVTTEGGTTVTMRRRVVVVPSALGR